MTHFSMAASLAISGVFAEQMARPSASVGNSSLSSAPDTATDDLLLTEEQVSWITSVYGFGNMVGFLLSSFVNPRLGTLRLVQLSAPLVAGGWLMMGLGNSFPLILSGRVLTGVAIGVCLGPALTHIGEVASVPLRSALTLMLPLMGCAGLTCAYVCGWLLAWRRACVVIGTVPMAIQLLISLPLPRSARWLISKGYSQVKYSVFPLLPQRLCMYPHFI